MANNPDDRAGRIPRVLSLLGRADVQLVLLAAVTICLYLWGLALPYNIFDLWKRGRINLGAATQYQPGPMARISLVLAGSSLAYWLALRVIRRHSSRTLWAVIVSGALAFNLILLFMYPIGANDVFDYIFLGRIQAVYHQNPFYAVPASFPNDPFSKYAFWQNSSSAYGPLWEVVSAGQALIAGDGVVSNILIYKLAMVLASAALTAIVAWGMSRHKPELALYSVTLIAWNPLVVYSAAGHGHNDALMAVFIALGCVLMMEKRYTLAALAETAGALVKFIPALIVPVVFVAALKGMSGWKTRLRFIAGTGAACAALVVAAYLPYFHGGDIMSVGRRTALITTSIGSLLQMALQGFVGLKMSQMVVTGLALAALGGWVAARLIVLWHAHEDDHDAPLRESLAILLFYLLVSCLWFQPWYQFWPLTIAALLPGTFIAEGAVLYALISLWKFPIFHFLIVRGRTPRPGKVELEVGMTLLIHGPMWVYFGLDSILSRFRKPAGSE